MLFNSRKQELIIIAENNRFSVARITEELQNNGYYNFKFAVNGAELYQITRTYFKNSEAIGLIIISDDLPGCQTKDLSKRNFSSHSKSD